MRAVVLAIFLILIPARFVFAENEHFVYNDHGKRDPFLRLVTPGGAILNYDTDLAISDITLEGIIYDPGGKSFAIINGIVVKPDDKLGLFLVVKIEKRKVTLVKGQQSFVLELKKEE